VLIGRRYLAISGAKQKAKIRHGQEKLAESIESWDTKFTSGVNQQPKWQLLSPDAEL